MVWAELADARAPGRWPDAATIDDQVLTDLLAVALEQCEAFLPEFGTPAPTEATPSRVLAQVLQARDIWAASRREGDVIGFDAYAVKVRPLSSQVRALLRPATGAPRTG